MSNERRTIIIAEIGECFNGDFDIAKKLNQNIHRFSVEWSRIEPEEGRFNDNAMQHYINVVNALRERGVEPIVTLWHFTNPIWFARKGGFLNIDSPRLFTRYAKYVVNKLKNQVRLWITFNEATTIYNGFAYLKGLWPPQHKSIFEWKRVNKNVIKSHIKAYQEIRNIYSPAHLNKEVQPLLRSKVEPQEINLTSHNVMIGIVENNTYLVPGRTLINSLMGKIYNYYRNLYFFSNALPYYDFIGLNYYHIERMPGSDKVLPRQNWWMEQMNWEIYPKGIYFVLKQLKRFKKPIYITENGTSGNDILKARFIKEHLRWVWEAIQEDVDIRGYMYWSLLDNFEWHHGFTPCFGLVEVDHNTFERRICQSAWEYKRICETNSLEM